MNETTHTLENGATKRLERSTRCVETHGSTRERCSEVEILERGEIVFQRIDVANVDKIFPISFAQGAYALACPTDFTVFGQAEAADDAQQT